MTDTDRLAALLQANALPATVGVTTNEDYWHVLAARLVAQGVTVRGDAAHAPGDPHTFDITCRVCGVPGQVHVGIVQR